MRKVIGILIMGIAIGGFILSMKYRSWDEAAMQEEYDKDIIALEKEIESSYPEKPDEVVLYHNKLMKIFYSRDMGEEGIKDYARTIRRLYADEFLSLNTLEQQTESLKKERETVSSSNLELVASRIVETYIIKGESGEDLEAEAAVQHTTNEGSINRIYHLVKEGGLWKIKSWENKEEAQDVSSR